MSESPHTREPLLGEDAEFERQLLDACEAPPIPHSLLKRLDRGVTDEWGTSPGLVADRGRNIRAAASKGARFVKAVPVVATAVALVLLAMLLGWNSGNTAWADVLQAMEERGIVRIEAEGNSRWLSLSEGIVSEHSADSSCLLDIQKKIAWERDDAGTRVIRRKLRSVKSRDQLALAFLLGGDFLDRDMARLDGVRLIEETWEQASDVAAGALSVTFESKLGEQFDVRLSIDADSHLPTGCEVDGAGINRRSVAMVYPQETLVTLVEERFPANLPRVDESNAVAFNDKPQSGLPGVLDDPKNPTNDPAKPMLFGAPSKWRPAKPLHDLKRTELVNRIDAVLVDLWKKEGVTPTQQAGDAELLRRVYLDLAGRIPSVTEVRSYLGDKSPNRYEKLVDRLLKSRDHASHIATVWRTFLIPEGVDLSAFGGVEAFDKWLAGRLASGDSYDEVVRSLLLARGRLSKSGPLLFYSAVKLDADQLASRTARVFLGMRLECAQCHDHPFEPWTQDDFWGFAAYFARISRPQAKLEAVSSVLRVSDIERGEVMFPDSEIVVQPKFLNRNNAADNAADTARRVQLADWLTSAENPYFARATANRVWGHLFGKGIVDPIDDFGTQHTPKSPELLELLAGHFIGSDFNLRELFRGMVLSRAYRLSSAATTEDARRNENFAQLNVKTLTAEQVYDCITVATMMDAPAAVGEYTPNVIRFDNSSRDAFIAQFRTPAGRTTEYLGGIPQALTLMNGSLIENATGLASSGLLKSLEAPFFTNDQRLEVLYFATLSRPPRDSEWKLLRSYIEEAKTPADTRQHLADILWALLNSAEFTLNH